MKHVIKHVRQPGIVMAAHFVLALVATYSLIFSITSAVVGGGDSAQNAWNLWWVRWAAAHGHIEPFFTRMLYAPWGVSLAYHPLGPFNGWMGILLQDVLGMDLVLTYNVITLATFVFTGLTTFYLVNYLVKDTGVAFVASLIFTYAPIRMSRVVFGNFEMYSTQFIPLVVYSSSRCSKLKNCVTQFLRHWPWELQAG